MRDALTMCGPTSALGLEDVERAVWPELRERLRQPGRLMGMMRGVLGGDAEVGVVVATTPAGITQPLALLVTPAIADELDVDVATTHNGIVRAQVGPYPTDVVLDAAGNPIAVLVSPWIFENLTVYARKLWTRR